MKIKKMVATFGNLRDSELKLSDGMNVVYGANESGKSTWGAFIRAMLYGISGRERSRQGFIADKEKFAPWSGEPMYGRMEFTHDGHEFGITRSAGKSGILQKAEVTKNSVAYPLASEPGDAFLGIKREVYERTAFIAQTAMEIERDKEGELERKITALASTGEEDVSGKLVEERLGKWKRRRRHNQHGEIPELNELLNTLRRKLDAKRADSVQLTNESARQRELEARRGALEKQRAERRGISAREQLGVIEDAAHEKKEAEEKLRNISSLNCR
ncbi:MAG: AAA family ATPase [Clostridia bacterium]